MGQGPGTHEHAFQIALRSRSPTPEEGAKPAVLRPWMAGHQGGSSNTVPTLQDGNGSSESSWRRPAAATGITHLPRHRTHRSSVSSSLHRSAPARPPKLGPFRHCWRRAPAQPQARAGVVSLPWVGCVSSCRGQANPCCASSIAGDTRRNQCTSASQTSRPNARRTGCGNRCPT